MRTMNLAPLFRSTIGFEGMQRLLDSTARLDTAAPSYPPYNIEAHGDDAYRITMAVAGFGTDDLEITVTENTLVVSGKVEDRDAEVKFLHRGIASRAFERRFELAAHIKVSGSSLDNGLLNIDLVREVPEEKKPRTVKIAATAPKALAA